MLYIWGPNPFNNRLLANYMQSVAGVIPVCISNGDDIDSSALTPETIFFCDCDQVAARTYCQVLQQSGAHQTPAICLLNVPPQYDLQDEIKNFGIFGIFHSTDKFELILQGIEKVLFGGYWLPQELLIRSLQAAREELRRSKQPSRQPALLTPREQEILQLITAGNDNQLIADRLFISLNTVKTHISNMYHKINVSNRAQAIRWASQHMEQPLDLDFLHPGKTYHSYQTEYVTRH